MDISEACETGNLDWLKQQKASGQLPQLMQKDDDYWYPHERAVANGHLEVLKWLVMESGQSVDVTVDSNAALRLAAQNGHLDLVKWLVLESGQPVDVTSHGDYAFQLAAENGHLDVVRWLVTESGQPVDVAADASCAVRWAALSGRTAIVDFLNFVTPLIQAFGLDVCRAAGFEVISETLAIQATSKSTSRRL